MRLILCFCERGAGGDERAAADTSNDLVTALWNFVARNLSRCKLKQVDSLINLSFDLSQSLRKTNACELKKFCGRKLQVTF